MVSLRPDHDLLKKFQLESTPVGPLEETTEQPTDMYGAQKIVSEYSET